MTDLEWMSFDKPQQLTREHLKRMNPAQIYEAHQRGHFTDLMAPKPNPWHDVDSERIHQAVATGGIAALIHELTTEAEQPTETEENTNV